MEAYQDPAVRRPARRRGPWFWVALGAGGCVLLVVLACAALALAGNIFGRRIAGNVTTDWATAAERTNLELYRPAYLPDDAGQPQIIPIGFGETVQTVTATYGNGLTLVQVNQNPSQQGGETAEVEGADEAYFGRTGQGRALNVRRGQTWISLLGQPDRELIRIAESLEPVQE